MTPMNEEQERRFREFVKRNESGAPLAVQNASRICAKWIWENAFKAAFSSVASKPFKTEAIEGVLNRRYEDAIKQSELDEISEALGELAAIRAASTPAEDQSNNIRNQAWFDVLSEKLGSTQLTHAVAKLEQMEKGASTPAASMEQELREVAVPCPKSIHRLRYHKWKDQKCELCGASGREVWMKQSKRTLENAALSHSTPRAEAKADESELVKQHMIIENGLQRQIGEQRIEIRDYRNALSFCMQALSKYLNAGHKESRRKASVMAKEAVCKASQALSHSPSPVLTEKPKEES